MNLTPRDVERLLWIIIAVCAIAFFLGDGTVYFEAVE